MDTFVRYCLYGDALVVQIFEEELFLDLPPLEQVRCLVCVEEDGLDGLHAVLWHQKSAGDGLGQ